MSKQVIGTTGLRSPKQHVAAVCCSLLIASGCGAASEAAESSTADEGHQPGVSTAPDREPLVDGGDVPPVSAQEDDATQVTAEPAGDAAAPPTTGTAATSLPTSDPAPATPIAFIADREHYRVVRLTHAQWENTVRQLLRLDAPTGLVAGFTSDALVNTFANDEAYLEVGDALKADYAAAAQTLAVTVTANAALLARAQPETEPAEFIREFGRRAFRRPLSSEEEARYLALYEQGVEWSAEADFAHGVQLVIEAMLQAPQFLYRSELGDDGAALNGYELASKLSFALLDVAPDVELLDKAAQGEFDTAAGVAAAAVALLDTPAALQQMRSYHSQVFRLGRLRNIEKTADAGYDASLNPTLELASHLFFESIVFEAGGVRDIFETDMTWVTPELAALYGLADAAPGWQQVHLGASRKGYFMQLPFLIQHATNLTPDPIHRGAELQDRVLCGELVAPFTDIERPARADTDTNRQYIANLTEQGDCAGCHASYVNPLGFAFENFDGLGQVRTTDNGQPVDTAGAYPFVEGWVTFANASELMTALASSTQVHECYVKHLGEFLLARQLLLADKTMSQALARDSHEGQSIKALITAWVESPQFRMRIGAEQ